MEGKIDEFDFEFANSMANVPSVGGLEFASLMLEIQTVNCHRGRWKPRSPRETRTKGGKQPREKSSKEPNREVTGDAGARD